MLDDRTNFTIPLHFPNVNIFRKIGTDYFEDCDRERTNIRGQNLLSAPGTTLESNQKSSLSPFPTKNRNVPFLQKAVIFSFRSVPDSQHFYLTGGTALAEFYLGHRKSFDLDLFTAEKGLIVPFSRVLEEKLKKEFSVGVVRRFESFADFPDEIEKWPVEMTVDIDSRELKDTFLTLSRRMMERLRKGS